MVTAGKVFKLAEPTPLSDLASRLSGYRREEPFEEGDYRFTLITEIVRLMPHGNTLTGVYFHDYVTQAFHRGKTLHLPRTVACMLG
jgi:hypothetical protein